jgi:hypothetical protein
VLANTLLCFGKLLRVEFVGMVVEAFSPGLAMVGVYVQC